MNWFGKKSATSTQTITSQRLTPDQIKLLKSGDKVNIEGVVQYLGENPYCARKLNPRIELTEATVLDVTPNISLEIEDRNYKKHVLDYNYLILNALVTKLVQGGGVVSVDELKNQHAGIVNDLIAADKNIKLKEYFCFIMTFHL